MKIKSVKFNFIMNFILTASSILFPLITFPYISRVLLAAGNGKIAFATSIITYFMMFASLGIPTYGIRACAKIRDDKEKLSKVVQELLIINTITMVITYIAFLVMLLTVPQLMAEKKLLLITSIGIILNVAGVNWLYNALEQYAYITVRSLIFKVISIIMMFLWVKNPEDYIMYGAINVFAGAGSNILNFINLRKFVTLKKQGSYEFRKHMKPIMIFFATSASISVYTNLDVVMLGFMKDDVQVGYYNAAIKVKTILVSLITSLGTVLLPRLSYYIEKKDTKLFEQTVAKAFNFVMVFAFPVTIYFMMFARESIEFLAGKAFGGAILPMIILMPTVAFIGLSNITGIQILTPMNRENVVLISIICGAILDFILNLLLIPKYGVSGAALATTLAECTVLVVQVVFLRSTIGKIIKQVDIKKTLLALGASGVVVFILKRFMLTSPFIMLFVSAILFFGIYGMLLWLQKEPLVRQLVTSTINIVWKKKNGNGN